MKIVYYEHNSFGHYSVYAKTIIELLHTVNVDVTLVATTALINQVTDFIPNCSVNYIPLIPVEKVGVFGNRWRRLKYSIEIISNVKKTLKANKVTCDLFHFGTVFSHELTLGQQLHTKLATQVTGYMVHAPFHTDGSINALDIKRSIKYLKLDRMALTESNSEHMNILDSNQIKLLPDFTDLRVPNVPSIQKPKRTRVLMIGVISERKGLKFLLDIIKSISQNLVEFMIVGPWDEQSERYQLPILSSFSNVIIINKFINDGPDFNSYILSSDIVFAAYDNHLHSSNVIIKANHFGVTFCVSPGGWMENYAMSSQNGIVITRHNVREACFAITSFIRPAGPVTPNHVVQKIDKSAVLDYFLK